MYAHAKAFWESFEDEAFLKEKFRANYHFAHNLTDILLAEEINTVLSGDDKAYKRITTDHVANVILGSYDFPNAPKKEQLLVRLVRSRMRWGVKLVIALYYNDFIFRKTRRFFARSLRK